jgi:hypothetical protein
MTDKTQLAALEIRQLVPLLREGKVSAVEVVEACLARIAEVDGEIAAWAHLDAEFALRQARDLDRKNAVRNLPVQLARPDHTTTKLHRLSNLRGFQRYPNRHKLCPLLANRIQLQTAPILSLDNQDRSVQIADLPATSRHARPI